MDFIRLIFQCWALQIYPRNILEIPKILKKKKKNKTPRTTVFLLHSFLQNDIFISRSTYFFTRKNNRVTLYNRMPTHKSE